MAQLRILGSDVGLYRSQEEPPAILVLSKRYDEQTLGQAHRLQQEHGTRVIFDLCDNHFYADTPSDGALRRASQLRQAIAMADAATVSTKTLAQVVRSEVPALRHLFVVDDMFEAAIECPAGPVLSRVAAQAALTLLRARLGLPPRALRLVWFGHHGSALAASGMLDLLGIMAALNATARRHPLSLTIISNHRSKFEEVRAEANFRCFYHPWSAMNFSRAARLHDVALLPVRSNPFTACKTNNRLATALLHGLAVVADRLPSYQEFEGAVMFGDWERSLERLAGQPELRQQSVQLGVRMLRAKWSPAVIAREWASVLAAVAQIHATPGSAVS